MNPAPTPPPHEPIIIQTLINSDGYGYGYVLGEADGQYYKLVNSAGKVLNAFSDTIYGEYRPCDSITETMFSNAPDDGSEYPTLPCELRLYNCCIGDPTTDELSFELYIDGIRFGDIDFTNWPENIQIGDEINSNSGTLEIVNP